MTRTTKRAARIVFGYWVFSAVLALFVALPVRAIVDRSYGNHPEGDAVLFRPGALELSDLVYRFDPSTSAIPSLVFALLVASLIVGAFPLAAALASLDGRIAVYTRAARVFPRIVGALVAFGVMKVVVALGGFALARYLISSLTESQGEVRAATWGFVAFVPFAIVLVVLGVLQDFVYAELVRRKKIITAIVDAIRALRLRKLASVLHWSARAVASIGVLLAGAMIAGALGGKGGFALALLFLAHQCVQIARIALRVNWLGYVVKAGKR